MTNSFYNKTGIPATSAPGLSQDIRAEFAAVEAGFNKLPTLSGNAGKSLIVNAGGNAVVADPVLHLSQSDIARGTDIAVVASGSVTIPAIGSYFVVTGTGFNVTGFANSYNGRTVTLKFSAGLTLVHSATFALSGGFNIITSLGDVGVFANESAGTWRCISYTRALGNPRLKAHRNSVDTTTFASGVSTKVSFSTETYDPYGLWDTGVGTGTIKEAGHYRIVFQAACATTGISVVATLRKNGGVVSSFSAPGAVGMTSTARVELTDDFAVNDTFECYVFWVTGTNAMSGNPSLSFLSLDKVDV